MMENAKISVIMPVYGVEAYVGKAIESIQKQTYKNWEFFCVDDGTKDRSGEICDEYAAKDPRIKVIHKENGGAPSARNVAIDQATGKYLYNKRIASNAYRSLIGVAQLAMKPSAAWKKASNP